MKSEAVLQRKARRYKNIFKAVNEKNNRLSRADLCEITKNSMTSVNQSITSLITDGLIVEQESSEVKVGRKPMFLSVIDDCMYFCGIECSSYNIDFMVIDATSQIINKQTISINTPDAGTLLNSIKAVIEDFSASNPDIWEKTKSITFSLPGNLDKEKGKGVDCSSISDWVDVDVKEFISTFTDKKTFFIHNIDSLLLGYIHKNNLPSQNLVVFIMIRNGVGVRIYSNETLLSDFGIDCEFGHSAARGSSRLCKCGRIGCYNAEITIPATLNKIRELALQQPSYNQNKDLLTGDDHTIISNFTKLCSENDEIALRLLKDSSKYIADLISDITYICTPDKVVLSSEFSRAGQVFEEMIQDGLTNKCRKLPPDMDFIVTDNDYGSIGCALTGYNAYLDDEDDYDELTID